MFRLGRIVFCGLACTCLLTQGSTAQSPTGSSSVSEPLSPIVSLNHLMVYLDRTTADAIVGSQVVKDFASLQVRTVQAGGGEQWTGLYIFGRETYIEIFPPGEGRARSVGTINIALGGDAPGFLESLQKRLASAGTKREIGMRRRTFGSREVDWFKFIGIQNADEHQFAAWALEYVPSFFDEPEAGKEGGERPGDTISRERYNSDDYKNHSVRDIVGVEIASTEQDFRHSEALLRAAGFRVTITSEGARAVGADLDLVFHFVAPERIGLKSIQFVLNRAVPSQREETIGNSRLRIGPADQALWVFGILPANN